MKKLLKLPLLLITLFLIFSFGKNVNADFEKFRNLVGEDGKINMAFDDEDEEKQLELLSEAEEILSFYVNDANSDETLSFIRLLNDAEDLDNYHADDRKDLEESMEGLKLVKEMIIKY